MHGLDKQSCLLFAGSVDNTRAALHFATAAGRVVMRPQLNKVASNRAVIKAVAAEIMQLKSRLVSHAAVLYMATLLTSVPPNRSLLARRVLDSCCPVSFGY
jgi:hypothetical protein